MCKTNRLIITGIPSNINETQITHHIKQYFQNDSSNNDINICKIKNKKAARFYQLIIETDQYTTTKLLSEGRLQIGTQRCRISVYRPVIRCFNCQLYGHGALACRRLSICAFCAQGHHTGNCTNTTNSEMVNCTNCLERTDYVRQTHQTAQCSLNI